MINTILETRPKEVQMGEGQSIEEKVKDMVRGFLEKMPVNNDPKYVRELIDDKKGPARLTVTIMKNDMPISDVARGLQVPLNVFLL